MATVKVDMSGLKTIRAKMLAGSDKAAEAMARGTAEESQEYVPRDTGALADSMVVKRNSRGSWGVSYGSKGPSRDYAVPVHNQPLRTYPSGGTSQFLRRAVMNKRARLMEAAEAFKREVF